MVAAINQHAAFRRFRFTPCSIGAIEMEPCIGPLDPWTASVASEQFQRLTVRRHLGFPRRRGAGGFVRGRCLFEEQPESSRSQPCVF